MIGVSASAILSRTVLLEGGGPLAPGIFGLESLEVEVEGPTAEKMKPSSPICSCRAVIKVAVSSYSAPSQGRILCATSTH